MSVESLQIVIIGAGIIGCSVAYELAAHGLDAMVLEKGPRIAEGVTSRNSGVIHAGLYYPPDSLKAQSCIRGGRLLYEWCEKYHVPFKKTGKLIVGNQDDEPALSELYQNAKLSGAKGISWQNRSAIESDFPGIRGDIALFSCETGIVDPYEYALSFQIQAEKHGAVFFPNSKVFSIMRKSTLGSSFLIETSRGQIEADVIINAAGLYADDIAAMVGLTHYKLFPFRGDYFFLSSKQTFKHLVYPVKKKNAPGLGIHLTIGLDGSLRLGPDVYLASSKEDFGLPPSLEEKQIIFHQAAQRYLQEVRLEDLRYDTCGIRPKLRAPSDESEKDFILAEDLPGFISLMGIESPGLTAAKDLAERVLKLILS